MSVGRVSAGSTGLTLRLSPIIAQTTAPDHEAILANFHEKVEEFTMTAVCGRRYVLVERLLKWLRSPIQGTHINQASNLIYAAYYKFRKPTLPIGLEIIAPGHNYRLLAFSILLLIGRGELIDSFTQ